MTEPTPLSVARRHQLRFGVAYGLTDVGLVRRANEDNFLIDEALSLVVVADGLGGHDGGAFASADAIRSLRRFVENAGAAARTTDADRTVPAHGQADRAATQSDNDITLRDPAAGASTTAFDAVVFANQCLFSTNLARRHQEGQGMGTTMTGLWQLEDGAPLIVFHVGDTRLYRYRPDGLVALTHDQTLYQRAIESGATVNLPARNLLWQAIGPYPSIVPEIRSHPIQTGDIFLLCSDGLHGSVPHLVIEGVIASVTPDNLDQAASKLIALGKAYGGRDNITAILIYCPGN